MADHLEHKEYGAEDFERYYTGKMSALEMHQLEKAAMEDPFLADALEGYSYTKTPLKDKEYLQTRLQAKTQPAKLVSLQRFNKVLRIAALFVLLAGGGWAVYQLGFNKSSKDIAVLKQDTPAASSAVTDTNNNESDLQQSLTNTDTNSQNKTIRTEEDGTVALSTQNRHTGRNDNITTAKKEKRETNEAAKLEEEPVAAAGRAQTFSLPANQENKLKTNDTQQFSKEARQFSKTDSHNVASAQQTVTPGKENVIVLQRNRSAKPIQEVVLGKSMRDSNYRKAHISFEEAEPEKGTAYYDDYVARNLQIPEEELRKNVSGEVRLAFDINDAGQAVNITVEKSLCDACDKEAIRVLQQGPKWVKKKKNQKGKLSIKF